MAGEIWVESREDKGSSFYFTCVLETVGAENESTEPSVNKRVAHKKEHELRLLLAEDDKVSRMVIERIATKRGWKVIGYPSR